MNEIKSAKDYLLEVRELKAKGDYSGALSVVENGITSVVELSPLLVQLYLEKADILRTIDCAGNLPLVINSENEAARVRAKMLSQVSEENRIVYYGESSLNAKN